MKPYVRRNKNSGEMTIIAAGGHAPGASPVMATGGPEQLIEIWSAYPRRADIVAGNVCYTASGGSFWRSRAKSGSDPNRKSAVSAALSPRLVVDPIGVIVVILGMFVQ